MKLTTRNLSLGIAMVLVMALNNFAHAEDRKIGVAVSAVINGSPGTGPEVSEALGAAIAAVLKAEVVAGTESQNLLPESARSETCLGDSDCLVAAGKAMGVDELLMLIIIDSAEEVKIEATWVDVASGKTALRPSISASKSSDSMAEQFAANAASLLPGIESRSPVVDEEPDPNAPVDPVDPIDSSVSGNNQPGVSTAGGHYMSPLATKLLIGGGIGIVAGLGYGVYRYSDCESSFNSCEPGGGAVEVVADVAAIGGAIAVGLALRMYFTSDSTEEAPPISLSVSDEAVAFSLGGQF